MPNVTGSDMNDDINNIESYTGIAAGVYASIDLLPNLAVQPELLYSQKGFKNF